MIDDPVVGGIGTLGHHDVADHGIARRSQTEIRNEGHNEPMPLGNAGDFGLDRARISVDVDFRHGQ